MFAADTPNERMRRLQVHALSCDCPVFVFRPEQARRDASPAPMRLVATFGLNWELHTQILERRGGQHDGILTLPSIPAILAEMFTPRPLRPSHLMTQREASNVNALGRAAEPTVRRHLAHH